MRLSCTSRTFCRASSRRWAALSTAALWTCVRNNRICALCVAVVALRRSWRRPRTSSTSACVDLVSVPEDWPRAGCQHNKRTTSRLAPRTITHLPAGLGLRIQYNPPKGISRSTRVGNENGSHLALASRRLNVAFFDYDFESFLASLMSRFGLLSCGFLYLPSQGARVNWGAKLTGLRVVRVQDLAHFGGRGR